MVLSAVYFAGVGKVFLTNKKIITIWYMVAMVFIAAGVVTGVLYYVYNFLKTAEIKNYLDGYTNSLRNGMNLSNLVKTALKSNSFLFFAIALSSFFRFGPFVSGFFLIRKGFISAFTTAAMIDVYGFSGLILAGGSFIQIVLLIPILAVFAAASVFCSKNRHSFEKRDKIIYIIFLAIVFTIFCSCALLEGIITTTFMKWLAFRVT